MEGFVSFLLLTALQAAEPAAGSGVVHRVPVPNGGELVTVFREQVPLVSYLKDTLGDEDPANDRIREVWILTQKRQSWPKHLLAAVPFLYTRLPSKPPPPGKVPRSVVDLSKPQDATVSGLFQQVLQVTAFDPLGTPYRAATRSYRLNRLQHRDLRIAEAASALSDMTGDPDVRMVRSRLILTSRLLGGLVSDRNLDLVNEVEAIRSEEMRGRNWELLRQQAERNNLIFRPLQVGGGPASHALLLAAREDLVKPGPRPVFHSRFLGISSPWTDDGLFRKAASGDAPEQLPLGLYSLEHPKAPYLLADMRDTYAPKRREIVRRAAQDATVGLLGFSRFANLQYFAATWAWNFIGSRRGAANNRAWRVRSYATLRQKLNADTSLDPELRDDLKRRLAKLSLNPLEDRIAADNEIARVQYESLRRYAIDPKGLAIHLERGRQREAAMFARSHKKRVALELARWVTLGLYQGRVRTDAVMLAEIDRRRKVETYARRLEWLMDAAPLATDAAAGADPLWQTARELNRLGASDAPVRLLLHRLQTATGDVAIGAALLALPAPAAETTPVSAGSSSDIENKNQ
jgi:hypothetical protein